MMEYLPGSWFFHDVFQVVPDDVRLLQELAHVVREAFHCSSIEALQATRIEQLHETGCMLDIATQKNAQIFSS